MVTKRRKKIKVYKNDLYTDVKEKNYTKQRTIGAKK